MKSTPIVSSSAMMRRISAVHRPKPVLDRDREGALSGRQRELLDQMERLFANGFANLTMAQLASRLNCSLRTLYAIAPSRDELVLIAVDRNLWRVGRAAHNAIRPHVAPLAAVRAYLETATIAVSGWTEAFARDLAALPATRDLYDGHNLYLFEVTKALLDLAVEQGDILKVDTAAVGRVLAGLGRFFSDPDVIPTLRSSPKEAADTVVDLLLRGLLAKAHEEEP
jgi:AcrR family transcriptional regulator